VTRERRFALEARAASLVTAMVGRLPRGLVLALGRSLGRILADLDRRHVDIAVDNLRRAFPGWDDSRARRTAHAVYAHFGQTLLDILWLSEKPKDVSLGLVVEEGREHALRAKASGRGTVFATAHLGNWELYGVVYGWLVETIGVIARPLDNPELDRRLCAFRQRSGNAVIYKQRALVQVLRRLKDGGAVAILVDQNVQEQDGIFVDFFGRKAATTTVAAALAVKTGATLLPSHCETLPDGRYRLVYGPPLEWTPSGSRERDIADLTQRLTTVIEGWIREVPEQWLWMHRRWKTQPRTELSAVSDQPSAGTASSGMNVHQSTDGRPESA
jgi:KDO2-lipid IV(A) lauroyltransferase